MKLKSFNIVVVLFALVGALSMPFETRAQERIKIAYSSPDATNFTWFAALDAGFYRKNGLEVELIFIQSSTAALSSLIAGDIQVSNNSGGAVANAVVGGALLAMTALCQYAAL